MKKVLGLAILSALWATPAVAGNTFAFSQWTIKQDRNETETNVDYTTRSSFKKEYSSSSDTTHIEGNTIDRAASRLSGSFREDNTTRVWGTINTITNSYRSIHETSAGIR
jgi:hypothetical protein